MYGPPMASRIRHRLRNAGVAEACDGGIRWAKRTSEHGIVDLQPPRYQARGRQARARESEGGQAGPRGNGARVGGNTRDRVRGPRSGNAQTVGSTGIPGACASLCFALAAGSRLAGRGRLAQRESASFTPRRSLVRSQYRPPGSLRLSGGQCPYLSLALRRGRRAAGPGQACRVVSAERPAQVRTESPACSGRLNRTASVSGPRERGPTGRCGVGSSLYPCCGLYQSAAGSGCEQAKAEFRCIEIDEIAVAIGPPA
jgi:hypothetical protein